MIFSNKQTSQGKKLSIEVINQRLNHRGITISNDYVNVKTKASFTCSYNHEWTAIPQNVLNENSCPLCARNKRKLTIEIVNDRIKDRGIKQIGEYLGNHTKTLFRCSFNHEWMTQPSNVMSGKECPYCSNSGFNFKKSAHFYILDFGEFIKYGISNNLSGRLYTHRRKNGNFTLVLSKFYEIGSEAYDIELQIKSTLGGNFVEKDKCPDGFTETLSRDLLDKVLKML